MNEIDNERMSSISNRLNKSIEDYSQLSDDELYIAKHLSHKIFYRKNAEVVSTKRISDLWEHKRKSEMIKTYADYFKDKCPDIHFHQDSLMAQMKSIKKPRIDYLYPSTSGVKNSTTTSATQIFYFPIEFLRYAPLNIVDLQLLQKLPSILVRITQLYYIEQLRILFSTHLNNYSVRTRIVFFLTNRFCLFIHS
jgi:hypothetical protein